MSEVRARWLLGTLAVGGFAALLALELLTETEPVSVPELIQEALQLLLLIGSATGVTLLSLRLQKQDEGRLSLLDDLETARHEGAEWRDNARTLASGLGTAIETQFSAWKLSSSEKDVGLLMLKGFVHKEIGALRGTTEATIRQQAASIYKKSALSGRAAFCAYFLEDILSPLEDDESDR